MAIEGDASSGWGKLVRFRNRDGQICEEIVSDGALHSDLNELIKYLAGCGMIIKGTLPARRSFAEYLLSVNATDRVSVVSNTGWIEVKGERAFALPGEIIGAAVTERVVLAKNSGAPYSQQGTLADWNRAVAIPAGKHLMLRFSLSTALGWTAVVVGRISKAASFTCAAPQASVRRRCYALPPPCGARAPTTAMCASGAPPRTGSRPIWPVPATRCCRSMRSVRLMAGRSVRRSIWLRLASGRPGCLETRP